MGRHGAHPRSRGDHPEINFAFWSPKGSSPLARGPHHLARACILSLGLIPARAGTTSTRYRGADCRRAHPRSRGDHPRGYERTHSPMGSSPLARGPPEGRLAQQSLLGLIPARAGTTLIRLVIFLPRRAHPRSRGDHSAGGPVWGAGWGSSPLARGPQQRSTGEGERVGLIPARAGTTGTTLLRRHLGRAHPRSRGDHSPAGAQGSARPGSSPLARGPRRLHRG